MSETECPVEAVFPDQSLPCLLERGHEPPHKYTPDLCGTCGCLPDDPPCGGCTEPGCPCADDREECQP